MTELQLTDYSSADIDEVWNWEPSDSRNVCFQFEIEISEMGKKGGTLFQVVVATPEGLRSAINNQHLDIPDRNVLIFDRYSWESLVKRIGLFRFQAPDSSKKRYCVAD